jgi:predicted phage gp36 major capsid-like protein
MTPSEKIIQLESRVTELEKQIEVMMLENKKERRELRADLSRTLAEYRELLVNMKEEIEREKQDRRERRAKAIAQLKSE